MRANIYQGPNSCYAKREGVYITGEGVSARNAPAFLRFIERDLRRGWTYDHNCRKIRMTPRLAKRRAIYLIALARKHHGEREAEKVAEIVERWLGKRIKRERPRERERLLTVIAR
jgi:hypothetical protein